MLLKKDEKTRCVFYHVLLLEEITVYNKQSRSATILLNLTLMLPADVMLHPSHAVHHFS